MQKMPLKYMLFQSAARKNSMNGSNSIQLLHFILFIKNLILQKLNIPFADNESVQHFVEEVKYRILEKQTNATP